MSLESLIQEKALELGYEGCGIVRIEDLSGYDERLAERISKIPEKREFYHHIDRLTNLSERYPWAKSVVVAIFRYGRYRVPENYKGYIGKHYVADGRVSDESPEGRMSNAMEAFLQGLGLKTEKNRMFGMVGMRWAAMTAGLGIIRRNNFFYTQSGSWVEIEAWMTDGNLELIHKAELPPCPPNCQKCMDACSTGALMAPYTMAPIRCIALLNTAQGRDLPNEPLARHFGKWIYGCDICQDACPMNAGKWEELEDGFDVAELAPRLSLEGILSLDEQFYREKVASHFFYIKPDELWKWKMNALNSMRNDYQEKFRPYILKALEDGHEKVREMARLVCNELSLE
jgi:epoxyqueuosine reductase